MQAINDLFKNTIKVSVAKAGITIPVDVEQDSYRWYRYVYTNLYKGDITVEERDALTEISGLLRDEHLICWTRKKMYPILPKISTYCLLLLGVLRTATNANVLRAALCFDRIIQRGNFYVDDYCLEHIPELQDSVCEETKENLV